MLLVMKIIIVYKKSLESSHSLCYGCAFEEYRRNPLCNFTDTLVDPLFTRKVSPFLVPELSFIRIHNREEGDDRS